MRLRQTLLQAGLAAVVVPLPFLAALDYKLALTWAAAGVCIVSYALYRRTIGQELVVALLFALVVTSYQTYVYTTANLFFGHINIYPLVLWTTGLVALREVYEQIRVKRRWVVASMLYIAVLFVFEYVGYYALGIHIDGNPPSLFGLGIIHGTPFIHIFYLLAGPIYLLVTDYLHVR